LSLFSGIGSFEYAVRDNKDYECVGYSEIDKNAIRVYESHYPVHRCLGDVRKITDDTFRELKPDLIVAGFPCTDISCAKTISCSKDKCGLDAGGQSSLFVELVRAIRICAEINPNLNILIENVSSMKKSIKVYITSVLRHVLGTRKIYMNVICSSHFSVQRRKRMFWTTWDLPENKDDLGKSTMVKPPYFKDIVRHDKDALATYKYVFKNGPSTNNNLIRCSKGNKKHARKTVTLPAMVWADTNKEWYKVEDRVYALTPHVHPYTRYSGDHHRHHSGNPKWRTVCAGENNRHLVLQKLGDVFKIRKITSEEMHACFGLPPDYCDELNGCYTRIVRALGNSIVVPVLQYIISCKK